MIVLFVFYGNFLYTQPGPLKESKNIVIKKGNISSVLTQLQKEHLLTQNTSSAFIFRFVVFISKKKGALRAAEFTFPEHISMRQIIGILRYAKPVQHELTVPEGLTSYQIASLINQAPFLEGKITPPEEGTVLPQTYSYSWGTSRLQLLKKMQKAMEKTVEQIWQNRNDTGVLTSSKDMVILASIVEKETAIKIERPMVARVFINRLKQGMKLQSDATIIYALTKGKGHLDRALNRQDWKLINPYNTYWSDFLPPTPICSPGIAALKAVAHPVEGNLLYFVANGTGGHSFSSSLVEHNRNIKLRKKN